MSNNSWMEMTTGEWNDAVVVGDLESPESQELLDNEFIALKGRSSRQPTGRWEIWRGTLRDALEYQLTHHPIDTRKEGKAFVFADGVPNGGIYKYPFSRLTVPLSGRKSTDINSVSCAGFDIDTGQELERTKNVLANTELFSILYTTHSHGRLVEEGSNETVDKFRILFPLAEPFQLHPEDPDLNAAKRAEWRERLVGFSDQMLSLPLDESGCDVNRLFFAPRHPPEATNWFIGVFGGRGLTLDDMPFQPILAAEAESEKVQTLRSRATPATRQREIYPSTRPILCDGFDLIDWCRDHGANFKIREFLKALRWQLGTDRPSFGEARSLCPNDDAHTSHGDTSACWVKDGTGEQSFVIYCHHTSCRAQRTLEHLAELEGFFAHEEVGFSDFLCKAEFYRRNEDELTPQIPLAENYRRWDPKEEQSETTPNRKGAI